jgi:hypothetical protein
VTVASPALLEARAVIKSEDPDLSNDEVGIVGGPSHIATGTSYHLGKDQLKMSKNPYSARTARDKAGLANPATANFASALDIDNDLDELREMSVWLVNECRRPNPHPDTLDIREIIYSPDGVTVWTWDREKGQTSAPEKRGESSHKEHTHFDWYRDAGLRDKAGIFRRFFNRNNPTGGTDMIPIPFGEGEKPGPASSRVKAMQLALVRAGGDLTPFGGPDGRYGNGTATVMVQLLGPIAGDGKLYDADQYDALQALAYGGGAKGDKGEKGDPGAPGATPTTVTFGPVVATVTAVTVPPAA